MIGPGRIVGVAYTTRQVAQLTAGLPPHDPGQRQLALPLQPQLRPTLLLVDGDQLDDGRRPRLAPRPRVRWNPIVVARRNRSLPPQLQEPPPCPTPS